MNLHLYVIIAFLIQIAQQTTYATLQHLAANSTALLVKDGNLVYKALITNACQTHAQVT